MNIICQGKVACLVSFSYMCLSCKEVRISQNSNISFIFSNHNFVIISDFHSKKCQTKPLLSSGHSMPPMDEADCRTSQKKLIKKPKVGGFLQCLGMQVVVLSTGGILPLLGRIVSCSEEWEPIFSIGPPSSFLLLLNPYFFQSSNLL